MAAFGLAEAYAGLLSYWAANPTGGTRAAFITQQTNAGFVEPMLNDWFDELLKGLRDSGYITTANYDVRLVPLIASVGMPAVQLATAATFDYLSRFGGKLYKLKRQYQRDQLTLKIDAVTADINDLQSARATILAITPAFTGQTLAGKACKEKIDAFQLQKASLQDAKQLIVDELALL